MAISLEQMKAIVVESTDILSENLRPEDELLRKLKTAKAIKPDEADIIRLERTNPAKMDKLLDILRTSPVTSYEALMVWLEKERNDLYIQVKIIQDKHCGKAEASSRASGTRTYSGNAGDKLTDMNIRTITHKSDLTRSQLQNLFQELGLKDHEIENAEMNADINDFQLQGGKVLRNWRQTRGKEATKGAILQAMKESKDLKEAMESLKDKWDISSI